MDFPKPARASWPSSARPCPEQQWSGWPTSWMGHTSAPMWSVRRRRYVNRPDVEHFGAVHFVDLVAQQVDQVLAPDFNDELVDGIAFAALQNVDGDDVTTDRTDA